MWHPPPRIINNITPLGLLQKALSHYYPVMPDSGSADVPHLSSPWLKSWAALLQQRPSCKTIPSYFGSPCSSALSGHINLYFWMNKCHPWRTTQHKLQKKSGNNLKCILSPGWSSAHSPCLPDWATKGGVKRRRSTSLQAQGRFFEHVNKPHGGDLLKADSHTPSAQAPAARGDILLHTIQRLVLFQDLHSALLPPPFHTVLLGEALQGLAQPGLSKAIRANYRYPVTGALGQARWGAQRPGGRAGVSLGQKEKATLGPTLSEYLPGSSN